MNRHCECTGRAIAYYFDVDPDEALHRNATRTGKMRVPDRAIHATNRKLEVPTRDEGFQELYRVRTGESGDFLVEDLTSG